MVLVDDRYHASLGEKNFFLARKYLLKCHILTFFLVQAAMVLWGYFQHPVHVCDQWPLLLTWFNFNG